MGIADSARELQSSVGQLEKSLGQYGRSVEDAVHAVTKTFSSEASHVSGRARGVQGAIESLGTQMRGLNTKTASWLQGLRGDVNRYQTRCEEVAGSQEDALDSASSTLSKRHAAKKRLLDELGRVTEDLLTEHCTHLRTAEHALASMETIVDHEEESELAAAAIRALWYNNAGCLEYWRGMDQEARKLWEHGMTVVYPLLRPNSGDAGAIVVDETASISPERRLAIIAEDWFQLAADISSVRSAELAVSLEDEVQDEDLHDSMGRVMDEFQQGIERDQREVRARVLPWIRDVTSAMEQKDTARLKELLDAAPRQAVEHPRYSKIHEVVNARVRKWSKAAAFLPCWVNYLTDMFNRRDFAGVDAQIRKLPASLKNNPNVLRVEGLVLAGRGSVAEAYARMTAAWQQMPDHAPTLLDLAVLARTQELFEEYDCWMARAERFVPLDSRVAAWRHDRPDFTLEEDRG